jgi:hypothetical protein
MVEGDHGEGMTWRYLYPERHVRRRVHNWFFGILSVRWVGFLRVGGNLMQGGGQM